MTKPALTMKDFVENWHRSEESMASSLRWLSENLQSFEEKDRGIIKDAIKEAVRGLLDSFDKRRDLD